MAKVLLSSYCGNKTKLALEYRLCKEDRLDDTAADSNFPYCFIKIITVKGVL